MFKANFKNHYGEKENRSITKFTLNFRKHFLLVTLYSLLNQGIFALAYQNQNNQQITIDSGNILGKANQKASGFLLSLSEDEPSNNYLLPLKPKVFRTRYSPGWGPDKEKTSSLAVQRMNKLGVRVQIMVHDEYIWGRGIPNTQHGWPGDNNSFEGLKLVIEGIDSKARKLNQKIEWDLWNEPDNQYFWKRSKEQFFNTWKEGYRMIKAKDKNATVIGPSIMMFRAEWLKEFLIFAKKNNTLPDILSWHELGPYKEITNHANMMRNFMKSNAINIQKISINEYCGPQQYNNPGIHVWYFAELERSKVDGACHACWPEGNGKGNCFNNSLDGIMTESGRAPRAVWHTYKAYADITGQLVDLKPTNTVTGIAGIDRSKNTMTLLLGKDSGSTENIKVNVNKWFRKGKAEIMVQKIPATGSNQLFNLPDQKKLIKQITPNNEIHFEIPEFNAGEAYKVVIK